MFFLLFSKNKLYMNLITYVGFIHPIFFQKKTYEDLCVFPQEIKMQLITYENGKSTYKLNINLVGFII